MTDVSSNFITDDSIAISVTGLSKTYQVWDRPMSRFLYSLCRRTGHFLTHQLGTEHDLSRYFARRALRGFREVQALNRVSFQIGKGEVVGVVGYNGSGKSTLLQILAGTLTPTEGSVQVKGRVAALLELGSGFNMEFTGRENAFLYGSILGVTREAMESRMHAIEEFAEIGEFIDEPVKTYSTGMVARLAFSVLTQLDPDILIVDEALAVGDAYFQQKSVSLIRQFQLAGKTMLVVSHDIATVKSMCSRAIILERGVVVREGPAIAVCDYYNALVAKKQKDHEILQTERERGRIITRSGDRRVVVGDVELLNRNGLPSRAFTVGEDARLACAIEMRFAVENPTVGALIRDRLGNDVFGSNTFHQRTELGMFSAGNKCEVTFRLTLNLAPGRYSVTVAAHSGKDHLTDNFDWQDNVVVFDVLPGPEPSFIGTAWLPLTIEVNREQVAMARRYEWGRPIDFSAMGDAVRYKHTGWAHAETEFTWTDGYEAILRFELPLSETARTLRVRAAGFCTAKVKSQRVEIYLDDELLKIWTVNEAHEYEATLSKDQLAVPARRRLRLVFLDAMSPQSEGLSEDSRILSVRVFSLRID